MNQGQVILAGSDSGVGRVAALVAETRETPALPRRPGAPVSVQFLRFWADMRRSACPSPARVRRLHRRAALGREGQSTTQGHRSHRHRRAPGRRLHLPADLHHAHQGRPKIQRSLHSRRGKADAATMPSPVTSSHRTSQRPTHPTRSKPSSSSKASTRS